MYFCAGDTMILPSCLLLTRVWCHLIKNLCVLLRATKSKSDGSMSMMAVELRGVLIYIPGMVHVVLLRVFSQFYYVQELCNICLFAHFITRTERWSYCVTLLLLITSSFSVSDVTEEHNLNVGLFTKLLFARLLAIYSPWKIYSMFPPTCISCGYCCITFVPLFINLRHPRD